MFFFYLNLKLLFLLYLEGVRQLVVRHTRTAPSLSQFWRSSLGRTGIFMVIAFCAKVDVGYTVEYFLGLGDGTTGVGVGLRER